jgi:hypothetical protein
VTASSVTSPNASVSSPSTVSSVTSPSSSSTPVSSVSSVTPPVSSVKPVGSVTVKPLDFWDNFKAWWLQQLERAADLDDAKRQNELEAAEATGDSDNIANVLNYYALQNTLSTLKLPSASLNDLATIRNEISGLPPAGQLRYWANLAVYIFENKNNPQAITQELSRLQASAQSAKNQSKPPTMENFWGNAPRPKNDIVGFGKPEKERHTDWKQADAWRFFWSRSTIYGFGILMQLPRNKFTACHVFANYIGRLVDKGLNSGQVIDRIAVLFAGAKSSAPWDLLNASRPTLPFNLGDDIGYKPEFRQGEDQTHHAAQGIAVGYFLAPFGSSIMRTYEERGENSPSDIRLGDAASALGDSLTVGTGGRGGVNRPNTSLNGFAQKVEDKLCEKPR